MYMPTYTYVVAIIATCFVGCYDVLVGRCRYRTLQTAKKRYAWQNMCLGMVLCIARSYREQEEQIAGFTYWHNALIAWNVCVRELRLMILWVTQRRDGYHSRTVLSNDGRLGNVFKHCWYLWTVNTRRQYEWQFLSLLLHSNITDKYLCDIF